MHDKSKTYKKVQEVIQEFDRAKHAQEERDRSNGLVYSLDDEEIRDFLQSKCIRAKESPERLVIKAVSTQALNSLPSTQKRRIVLVFFKQKSYSEIARLESVDESAVRHSVERGLIRLRKKLKGTGVSAGDFTEIRPIKYVKHFHPKKETTDRQNKSTTFISLNEGGEQDEK